MIAIYKPNSKNTGSACNLNYDSKNGCIYIGMVKQVSWSNGKGSFAANAKNPEKTVNAKFNIFEIGNMIDSIRNNKEWKTYHKNEKGSLSITFAPYIKDGKQLGFGLRISKNEDKISFPIGFTSGEIMVVEQFLCYALRSYFNEHRFKRKETAQTTESPKEEKNPVSELFENQESQETTQEEEIF